MENPETQLESFLDKYTPEIATRAREILAEMRRRLPGAVQLVYDNYNALAVGFGPSERASDAIFSIALYPRRVSLFFLKGAGLDDPHGILEGKGNQVRHIILTGANDLREKAIRDLIARALKAEGDPIDTQQPARLLIKSVSARQRPRRPAERAVKAATKNNRRKAGSPPLSA